MAFDITVGAGQELFRLYPVNPVVRLCEPERYAETFTRLEHICVPPSSPAQEMQAVSLALELFAHVLDSWQQAGSTPRPAALQTAPDRFQEVIAYMQAHLQEKLTRDDLARLAHLHPGYFDRAWRAAYGTSPLALLRDMRLRHARVSPRTDRRYPRPRRAAVRHGRGHPFQPRIPRSFGQSPGQYRQSARTTRHYAPTAGMPYGGKNNKPEEQNQVREKEIVLTDASAYLDKLRNFALALREDAERIDADSDVLAAWYARFVASELHVGWSPRQPLTGREFCEALAILAESSGAFGFVALQQFVANTGVGNRVAEGDAWPCVGVAFGHLRNLQGAAPRWDGTCASGLVPWLTGANCFPHVILGMRGQDGEEVYTLVETFDRAQFQHNPPMDLIACAGTCTISVQVNGLTVTDESVLKREPSGTLALNDARGVLYQTPLMVGCVRACHALIRGSSRVGAGEQAQCEQAVETLLQRAYAAFADGTAEEGQRLRAELGDFTVRLARLTAMACGGAGLARPHPAPRLYREALLYSLMAQTDAIVNQAFAEVFR